MPRNQRHYSDDERAAALAALAANRGNVSKTAREVGVPRVTLIHWRDQDRHPEAVENGTPKKAALADLFEQLAYQMLGVAKEKAGDLSARDATVAAGVCVDKMRQLRGEVPHDDPADRCSVTVVVALLERARARAAGAGAPPPLPAGQLPG